MSQDIKLDQLRTLVSLFSANIDQYKSNHYDESNTRTDFIDKLFTLLDWDVANNQGWSENYRDVVREDKVKIDGTQKAPDYSFRIGGARKFFVEAKKPSVNIKEASEPAYQVRRYAYTAKLQLSILTDFEEFAVYDTRIKPNKDDKASVGRIFYCTFDQYEENFDFIFNTFSKEAVLKGSFDKYVETNKNKKGTSEVDEELLALVEDWRIDLAKKIARDNPDLNIFDLNTVVQRIIDRIIFLRIAEDKGIEDEDLLFTVAQTENIYEKLIQLFAKANLKYNSGLFAEIDWIDNIQIDNKVLKNIIENLYYPECPYEFSVLPIEILGSIYERFLGKTIYFRGVKGDSRTAIIEEKPEVKKAGGVYYTPQYIVDYIVKNTVGEKIKNKTPDEIAKIKVCDPACGSGSFLVGAYQFLLNYHLDYYSKDKNLNSALKNKKIYESGVKSYKLTIEEKQHILTNCIYGVDIDSQAVEVTKLSLYLKLLENEGKQYKDWLFDHTDLTLLPSLENNIKCGNSLIGNDFYTQENFDFSDEERIKVNCFDWEKEFSNIFNNGGFDVVIGNPPYVNMANITDENTRAYFQKMFKTATNKVDLYSLFTEKCISLLKEKGLQGYIFSNSWLGTQSFTAFREMLIKETKVLQLVKLPPKVFQDATVTTVIIIFQKGKSKIDNSIILKYCDNKIFKKFNHSLTYKHIISTSNYAFGFNQTIPINIKFEKLHNLVKFSLGIKTSDDKYFISDTKKNKEYYSLLRGKDISKYSYTYQDKYIWYRPDLMAKRVGARPRVLEHFLVNKIIIKDVATNITATIDKDSFLVTDTLNVIHHVEKYDMRFILALLNSKFINKWFKSNFEAGLHIKTNQLGEIPIPSLDLSIKSDKTKHDNLVSLVDKMLELKQKEAAEKNEHLKTTISRQIDGIDAAIDKAVYELYGLTEDEIRLVENA